MNSFQAHYSKLNDRQKEAVDATDGPLLVLAGPGTGKTQLLSVRAANILHKKKIDPENILILTFTNAAARAMRERLASILGHDGYNIVVETFHGFANSIVLESEGAISFIKDKIELGEVEKVRAIEYILDNTKGIRNLRPFGRPYMHRTEIEKRISELKNEGILPVDFIEQAARLVPNGVTLEDKNIASLKELGIIYDNYEKLKDEKCKVLFDSRGRIDYDDMILIALEALCENQELVDSFREQYRYVMVDEYQDTNGIQSKLLFSIVDPQVANICCVGDDDQSIYRFQGATLSNFRNLSEKFPDLKKVSLTDNYRSTSEILELSGNIIKQLPSDERVSVKELKAFRGFGTKNIAYVEFSTEEEELDYIVGKIKDLAEEIRRDETLSDEERKKPYNNIAVLVRTRAQIQRIVDAFQLKGIAYATDGKENIRGEKRVRQMLDVLELANVEQENIQQKKRLLYKILSSDYVGAVHADVLKFISYVNDLEREARNKGDIERYRTLDLFSEFCRSFPVDEENAPGEEDTRELDVLKSIDLENPTALHKVSWAIQRMLRDAQTRPVHDIIMQYIGDIKLYGFILNTYNTNELLMVRDLRSLVSFINMIKLSDKADPALSLGAFMKEMDMREVQRMPVKGELATMSQDGVRVYTAHGSKGLEFYAVFMPFCLDKKSWPSRGKSDTVPLPPEIYKSKERVDDKQKIKLLKYYDELRLFYVASTRAKAHLVYTAAPKEKAITSPFVASLGLSQVNGAPESEQDFLVRFLEKKEQKETHAFSQDLTKDMVSGLDMTPTKLNTYINCRRKFFYNYVLGLPGKKNQHLAFGNCAHKALEEVYASYMVSKKFPSFASFERLFKEELEFQGVNDSIVNWCLDRLQTLKRWYAKESRISIMPKSLEQDLRISICDGLVFKGKFDKIEVLVDGTVRVVDYKTGKPDDHIKKIKYNGPWDLSDPECDDYYRQLIAYKLVFDRSNSLGTKLKIDMGVLQFLEPVSRGIKKYDMEKGEFQDIDVELSDKMVRELEDVIRVSWDNIQSLKFEKLSERDGKNRCARCEYDSICWGD